MKHPENDVHLSNGDFFMVNNPSYWVHLVVAKELKEVRMNPYS
jgi:hypothetical protein